MMASDEQFERVKSQGSGGSILAYIVLGLFILLSVLFGYVLTAIWGIIESLTVVTHLPLFDVMSPGNVNGFNGYFIEVTGYDYIDFDAINSWYMYMPEVDPLTLNFQMAGYDSVHIIPALGLLYYTIIAICLVVLIYFMLKPCASS